MEYGLKVTLEAQDLNLKDTFVKVAQASQDAVNKVKTGMGVMSREATWAFDQLREQAARAGKGLGSVSQPLAKLTTGSNRAAQALGDLSRVAQDAPYGFMAIQNNLNPMLESFQRLKAETGSTKGALKELASSLAGPVGVGLALSVASTLALKFGDDIARAFKSINQEADRFKAAFDGADGEFKKAASTVNELRINIDLARKGFLDKNDVVRQYNETLGKTTGEVKNLDEAEKALTRNGDAYVKMMLYKAAANTALGKAAEKAFEIAQKLNAPQTVTDLTEGPGTEERDAIKLANNNKELLSLQQQYNKAFLAGDTKLANQLLQQRDALYKKLVEGNQFKDIRKEQESFEKIAQDFQQRAAEISKGFNLDFFDFKDKKQPKGKANSKQFEFLYDFLPFNPDGNMKPEQRAKLVDSIDKFSKDFRGILEGADFRLLPNVKSEDDMIDAARKYWQDLQKGLVTFKPQKLEINAADMPPIKVVGEMDTSAIAKAMYEAESFKGGIAPITMEMDALLKQVPAFKKVGELIGGRLSSGFSQVFGRQFEKSILSAISAGTVGRELEGVKESLAAVSVVATDLISGIGSSVSLMVDAIAKGGNALQAFGQGLVSTIQQVITKLIQAAALGAILSLISGGAAGGGVSFLQGFRSLLGSGIPGMATGGIVPPGYPNDTFLARLSSNEAVIPLDRWKDIIPSTGGGNIHVTGEFRQRGTDLIAVISREQRSQFRRF